MTYPTSQPNLIKIGGVDRTALVSPVADIVINQVATGSMDTCTFRLGPADGLGISEFDTVIISAPETALEDETGILWGPENHRISLANGVASFKPIAFNLAAYTFQTPAGRYRIDLHDSSNKTAVGYLGSITAPYPLGSETLGSELLTDEGLEIGGTNGDFDGGAERDDGTSDNWQDWTEVNADGVGDKTEATATVHGGSVACKLIRVTASAAIYQQVAATAGKLYKVTFWTRGDGSNELRVLLYTDVLNTLIWAEDTGVTGSSYTEKSYYVTCPAGETNLTVYFLNTIGGTVYVDDVSFKEVTGTAGAQILDGVGSTTQNWNSIEGGFDYNDSSYTYEVVDTTRYFAGYITILEKDPVGVSLYLDCTCQDYTFLLGKTEVHKEYSGSTDAEIIADLFSTWRSDINATTYVEALLTAAKLDEFRFNRLTLWEALDKLAIESGGDWYLDYGPAGASELCYLHYFSQETNVAPYSITDSPDFSDSFPAHEFKDTRDVTDHVNRVTVVGGNFLSADGYFYFAGDAQSIYTAFLYEYRGPVATPDLIKVWHNIGSDVSPNWSADAVGYEFVDVFGDGFDVLWDKEGKHLLWNTAPPLLTLAVRVQARYLTPLRAQVQNANSFVDYGLWFDKVIVDVEMVSVLTAGRLGLGVLDRRAVQSVVTCRVREPGLHTGQRVLVTNTPTGIDQPFNIDAMTTLFQPGGMAIFELEMS